MTAGASTSNQQCVASKENINHKKQKSQTTRRRTKRRHDPLTNSVHPYQEVMACKMYKLKVLCDQISETAACDLILANRKSGESNFHPNLELANQMDMASKELLTLSKKMHTKAEQIHQNTEAERDQKRHKSGIIFMAEVTDPQEKVQLCQTCRPHCMKYTQEFKPVNPCVTVSDDEDMPMPTNNDPDTCFMSVKKNQNNPDKLQFQCDSCGKVLRDSNELNNHVSIHQFDLFHCIKCRKVCRSSFSFEKHMQTHYGMEIRCNVCNKCFDIKTSLINHMQKHSNDTMKCDICSKRFQYRQNATKHIEYAHREEKTVPCPLCSKMFQTPTNMRSH